MALAKTAALELRTTIDDVPARIATLMEERKKLERDLSDARKKLAMGGGASPSNGAAAGGVREVGNVKLLARAVEGVETKDLKSLVDDGKKQIGSGVVAIVGVTEDGKAGVVVGVTSDLTSRFSAVDLVARLRLRHSAARAAADGPTWRRPVGPMAPRPTRRCRRSKKRWPTLKRRGLDRNQAIRAALLGYFVPRNGATSFAGLLAGHDRHDLKGHADIPVVQEHPLLQQSEIVAFQQLEAPVEIGFDPAPDIGQAFRKFDAGIANAAVDRDRVPVLEAFDHHEQHWQSPSTAASRRVQPLRRNT